MNWWFLSWIGLIMLALGEALSKHGESKNEKHNFWTSLFGSLVTILIVYMAIKQGF